MPHNIDTALLRAFMAVAETASMTAAGHALNLTQAAVSQQIKRLEDLFGQTLFERDKRGVRLTDAGERLFGKARRMLAINDDIWAEMTTPVFKGKVRLGLPYDLINTHLPGILKAFSRAYPQVEVSLVCQNSAILLGIMASGGLDVALTEELSGHETGEILLTDRLVWVGSKGGEAYAKHPLPLSFGGESCAFRTPVFEALRRDGREWRIVSEAGASDCLTVTTQLDMAITAVLASTLPPGTELINPKAKLPALPAFSVTMHMAPSGGTDLARILAHGIREAFLRPRLQAA